MQSLYYKNPHQILGLVVSSLLVIQFVLGFVNHRRFKMTQRKPRLNPVHRVLGYVIIIAAIVNGFLGYPFGQNPRYNWFLGVLVVAMVGICVASFIWMDFVRRVILRKGRRSTHMAVGGEHLHRGGGPDGPPPAYDAGPWRTSGPGGGSGGNPYDSSPYREDDARQLDIGLADFGSPRKDDARDGAGPGTNGGGGGSGIGLSIDRSRDRSSRDLGTGPEAKPRELV